MVGLGAAGLTVKLEAGALDDVVLWSQRVIDLAGGDATKGNVIFGSPLGLAFGNAGHHPLVVGSRRLAG